jgi:hypothetical protein
VDGHNKLNLTVTLAVKYGFLFHIIRLQQDNDITMLNMQLTININYPVHGKVLDSLVEILTSMTCFKLCAGKYVNVFFSVLSLSFNTLDELGLCNAIT